MKGSGSVHLAQIRISHDFPRSTCTRGYSCFTNWDSILTNFCCPASHQQQRSTYSGHSLIRATPCLPWLSFCVGLVQRDRCAQLMRLTCTAPGSLELHAKAVELPLYQVMLSMRTLGPSHMTCIA
jgi:hypothetical protein